MSYIMLVKIITDGYMQDLYTGTEGVLSCHC
jgi:hypothetical protein